MWTVIIIYSITRKTKRTYLRILVDVLWSYVVEETREPGENNRPWLGDHYPAIWLYPGSNYGCSGDKQLHEPLHFPGLHYQTVFAISLSYGDDLNYFKSYAPVICNDGDLLDQKSKTPLFPGGGGGAWLQMTTALHKVQLQITYTIHKVSSF